MSYSVKGVDPSSNSIAKRYHDGEAVYSPAAKQAIMARSEHARQLDRQSEAFWRNHELYWRTKNELGKANECANMANSFFVQFQLEMEEAT